MQALTAIGITQKTITTCEEVDLSTSESGLYLDKLPGLGANWFAPDNDYGTCADPKSYVSWMVEARKEAHELLKEALLNGLRGTFTLQKHTFSGYIGQRQGTGLATSTNFTIKTGFFQDAHLHISKLGVLASGTGTVTVTLTSPELETQTFEISIENTGYTGLDVNIKLPLNGNEYSFDLATTGTVKLQQNSIGCGCGAKDTNMLSYLKFGSAYASGLSLTTAIKCEVTDTLSRLYTTDSDVSNVMARMLYYRAGVVLCDYIFGDNTPQDSDTDLEYIKAKRADLLQEYESRLQWMLETGLNVHSSACFACNGPRLISIG